MWPGLMSVVPDIGEVNRTLVPFSGEDAGTGSMTWGQQAIWREIQETGWTLNLGASVPLPADTTVDDVARHVSRYLTHYPAMRTRLRFAAGAPPRQVVSRSGEFAIGVLDVDDDDDPAQVADAQSLRSMLTAFDYEHEWPMRIALVRHRGVLTHRVWTMSHLATDGTGVVVMARAPAEQGGQQAAMSPLELARWEGTAEARRHSDAAMRHWEARLRSRPPRLAELPATSDSAEHQGRHWYARCHSPATYLGMLAIAARTRTDTARVLLAIFAVALARVSGVNPVVTRLVVNNRFRPGFAGIIAPISQHGLCAIDVADATIDEVVARARRATTIAAKHAYYDPEQLDEVVARVGHERGLDVRVGCLLNDRRLLSRGPADEAINDPPSPSRVHAAISAATVVWVGELDQFNDQLIVSIEDQLDTMQVTVCVDTQHLRRAGVEDLVAQMQDVAVSAAADSATTSGIASMNVHA